MTFTELEMEELLAFYNFIVAKSTMTLTIPEASRLHTMLVKFKAHLDKVNDNILELKKIIPAPVKGKK